MFSRLTNFSRNRFRMDCGSSACDRPPAWIPSKDGFRDLVTKHPNKNEQEIRSGIVMMTPPTGQQLNSRTVWTNQTAHHTRGLTAGRRTVASKLQSAETWTLDAPLDGSSRQLSAIQKSEDATFHHFQKYVTLSATEKRELSLMELMSRRERPCARRRRTPSAFACQFRASQTPCSGKD